MFVEKWDILDENGTPTGKTALRGRNFLKNGEYHLVVHIWIFSSNGKILIQKRSNLKQLMPGEWAATGGAAISGESSFTAAQRELFEELGIASDENTLKNALEVLSRLADGKRLVGDISHMPELGERIERRIDVRKTLSGSEAKIVIA